MTIWNNPPPGPVRGLQNRVFFSGILGDWVGLNLLLPVGCSPQGGPYPVLYWFHGEGGNESSGLFLADLLADGVGDENLPPFITVLVNWGNVPDRKVERLLVEELIPFVDANYPTVRERRGRSLEGVGTGAAWAVALAWKHPRLFASVSGFAASRVPVLPRRAPTPGTPVRIRLFAPDRNPRILTTHRALGKTLRQRHAEVVEEVLEGFHDDEAAFYSALGPGAFRFHIDGWGLPFLPYRRADRADGATEHRNLEFARRGRPLVLDLTVPPGPGPFPLVVYFFGGAFRFGGKNSNFGARLVADGYASASAQYRLTGEAPFPAQRDDARDAIRWLRGHAGEFRLDPRRIGVWGMSAGAWVATLLGVCPGDEEARVQAVCDFYGPTDFLRMDAFPGTWSHDAPTSAESRMVRGPIQKYPERVEPATPLNFVSADAPPFLIVHDPQDQYVPYDQSERLNRALGAAGVESTLVTTHETSYPFHGFDDQGEHREAVRQAVDSFFARHLKR